MNVFHTLSIGETFLKLNTSKNGLTNKQAEKRLKKYGLNQLPEKKRYSNTRLFFHQFNGLLVYILFASVIISFVLGNWKDGVFVIIVIFLNAFFGFFQEYKAEKTLSYLKQAVQVRAKVLRNGVKTEIDAIQLVPGDIIFIDAGDKVPADARLIQSFDLEVNEASLTGEAFAVTKDHTIILNNNLLPSFKKNMVFAGTLIEKGKAMAVVTATNIYTEIGKITKLIKDIKEPETPLQQKISSVAKVISIGIFLIIGIFILIGIIKGLSFLDIFTVSLAFIVSAIPAGLPVAITIVLIVGMRRLLSQKALVKRLNVAETLGSTSVICTDKTGTLTTGNMQVSHIWTGCNDHLIDIKQLGNNIDCHNSESHITALKIAMLTSEAFIENKDLKSKQWQIKGRSTDKALLLAALQAGLDKEKISKELPFLKELPFDSTLKLSVNIRKLNSEQAIFYILGAPENVIAKSKYLDINGKKELINSSIIRSLQNKNDMLAKKGLRVLSCAYKVIPFNKIKKKSLLDFIDDLVFVGFIALKDPIREEAKEALSLTTEAGIKTIIITGDNKYTTQIVAEELGMSVQAEEIMEGKEIEEISFKELRERTKFVKIYARVSPNHKINIIKALQANGEIVSMVGDGMNDAPSINAADIGVSVGSGEDIAKEASEMIILDDNFYSLVKAVEQGRIIFENIRKVIVYLIADDFSQVFILLSSLILGLPLALLPIQILFIDIIEVTFPVSALIFGKENNEFLMKEKPRKLKDPFFNKNYIKWFISIFLISGFALLIPYYFTLTTTKDINFSRTFVLALTAIDSLFFAFIVSSFKRSVFRRSIFDNHYFLLALVCGALLISAAIYLPILQQTFNTVALNFRNWAWILGISFIELCLIELTKYWLLIKQTRNNLVKN